jgi:hypothetical protein
VPEHQSKDMTEHEQYATLCALAAGGLLEGREFVDFHNHLKDCNECRSNNRELSSLVTGQLPQAQGTFRQKLATMRAKALPYSRQRFLRRARAEGLVFSPEVETGGHSWHFLSVNILAPVAVLVLVVAGLTISHSREKPETGRAKDAGAELQIAELKRENSALIASLSRLNESAAIAQRQVQNLRTELASENQRRKGQQIGEDVARSSSQTPQLLEESRNQEKLLAEARDEAARNSQLRVNDEASLIEQQFRITELTNKLRIASATLDQERQLAAAGKDVRELMASRQLHVIDVRDTDPNGKPSEAFGRVFLTEGKSLTFYAFDLNEGGATNAKRSFQVWAVAGTGKTSSRRLGFLLRDAQAQGRWVLKVENPELVKEVSSVFVTAESIAGGKQPSGQKMLYASLGEPNHP